MALLVVVLLHMAVAAAGTAKPPPDALVRVGAVRSLRGGSGVPAGGWQWQDAGAAPPAQHPSCGVQQPAHNDPAAFPGFQNGFVENGVPYAQQFAEQLRQKRQMGHTVPVPTPAMFAGEEGEGVSFDANGNFQLGEHHICANLMFRPHDNRQSAFVLIACNLTSRFISAAPPGFTPEEALAAMKQEAQRLADMNLEVELVCVFA